MISRLFRIGASGLRSSCPSVARNSSFRRSADRSACSFFRSLGEVAADLVLARARANRRLRRAQQRGDARRPLEQRDVAERAPGSADSGSRRRAASGSGSADRTRAAAGDSHSAQRRLGAPARCSSASRIAAAPSLERRRPAVGDVGNVSVSMPAPLSSSRGDAAVLARSAPSPGMRRSLRAWRSSDARSVAHQRLARAFDRRARRSARRGNRAAARRP